MFDETAPKYDLMNDVLSLGQDRLWRRGVVRAVAARPGERVLDLAAGTGASSAPFARAGAAVYPTDLSMGMLRAGRRRRPELAFVRGDATRLPYGDDVFDAATISFGLRNVEDTAGALRELRRVTRRGGRLVVCEFSRPTRSLLRRAYQDVYLRHVMPLMSAVSANPESYDYLAETILAWHDQAHLAELMERSGWGRVEWRDLTGGIVALHRGRAI
ncbi:class I SAM-dependent methyltransferase [uncultured Propionibacterium sp.]|uniref:class I SAM-dependent methyltransferase n=1 Tax=uncultured Propionibacterium sp. TaxID=218066 RepID=UPI0037DC20EE